jgi:MFS family permease
MILVDVIMAIALVVQAASLDLRVMYISRFIFGFFCGVSSSVIPPYLTSISPLSMTGFIGSFNQLLITIGISVAYALNFFLESDIMNKQAEISIFILIPLPFCFIRILTLTYIFPYYFFI